MLLASLSPVIVMSDTSGMAALIFSAAVWAVICRQVGVPPPWWWCAPPPLPPLPSWWLGAHATAQATTTAKQIGLSTRQRVHSCVVNHLPGRKLVERRFNRFGPATREWWPGQAVGRTGARRQPVHSVPGSLSISSGVAVAAASVQGATSLIPFRRARS